MINSVIDYYYYYYYWSWWWKLKGTRKQNKQAFSCAMGLPLCFFWGEKKKKKKRSNNNNNDEYVRQWIQNRKNEFIHPINILPNVVATKWNLHHSLSLPYTHPTNLQTNKGCGTHCSLAIYIKQGILRQKTNDGNSNISPCKNLIFKKKML